VGEGAVTAIARARQKDGPFKDIFDLCERVDTKQVSKSVLEILIRAGALDHFGPDRNQHLALCDRAIQAAAARARDRAAGQKSLFGGDDKKTGAPQPPPSIVLPDTDCSILERATAVPVTITRSRFRPSGALAGAVCA
ncbi:MAG: hypothetical protein ACKOFK_09480, partial [Betaproteobacteria bacterium]